MQSTMNDSETERAWGQLAPLLDEAMSRLSEKERTLVALRFFENKTGRETADLLGIEEWAAHKGASRALEKLRGFFLKRGISSTAAIIAGAISANSVHAAPAALAKSVTTLALAKGAAASSSTLTLIKGALTLMAWTKAKTAIVVGAALILAAGTTSVVMLRSPFAKTQELSDDQIAQYATLTGTTPGQVAKTIFDACGRSDWTEFARFSTLKPQYAEHFKALYGGVQAISLGKPFWAWTYGGTKRPQVFVPYEIRFKDGKTEKWQMALRWDYNTKHWSEDGGL